MAGICISAAMALGLAALASAGPAVGHRWHPHECCSDIDCAPVEQVEVLPRGDDGAKGNPPNPSGHRTSYLWEQVWQRDSWLEILGRYGYRDFVL